MFVAAGGRQILRRCMTGSFSVLPSDVVEVIAGYLSSVTELLAFRFVSARCYDATRAVFVAEHNAGLTTELALNSDYAWRVSAPSFRALQRLGMVILRHTLAAVRFEASDWDPSSVQDALIRVCSGIVTVAFDGSLCNQSSQLCKVFVAPLSATISSAAVSSLRRRIVTLSCNHTCSSDIAVANLSQRDWSEVEVLGDATDTESEDLGNNYSFDALTTLTVTAPFHRNQRAAYPIGDDLGPAMVRMLLGMPALLTLAVGPCLPGYTGYDIPGILHLRLAEMLRCPLEHDSATRRRRFPRLESLSVLGVDCTSTGCGTDPHTLRELNLGTCLRFDDRDSDEEKTFHAPRARLERLSVENCDWHQIDWCKPFAHLKALRVTSLFGINLDHYVSKMVTACPSLEELCLEAFSVTGAVRPVIERIASCVQLRVLDVSISHSAESNHSRPVEFDLSRLSQLRRLALACNVDVEFSASAISSDCDGPHVGVLDELELKSTQDTLVESRSSSNCQFSMGHFSSQSRIQPTRAKFSSVCLSRELFDAFTLRNPRLENLVVQSLRLAPNKGTSDCDGRAASQVVGPSAGANLKELVVDHVLDQLPIHVVDELAAVVRQSRVSGALRYVCVRGDEDRDYSIPNSLPGCPFVDVTSNGVRLLSACLHPIAHATTVAKLALEYSETMWPVLEAVVLGTEPCEPATRMALAFYGTVTPSAPMFDWLLRCSDLQLSSTVLPPPSMAKPTAAVAGVSRVRHLTLNFDLGQLTREKIELAAMLSVLAACACTLTRATLRLTSRAYPGLDPFPTVEKLLNSGPYFEMPRLSRLQVVAYASHVHKLRTPGTSRGWTGALATLMVRAPNATLVVEMV
jgi:hypothetical protein